MAALKRVQNALPSYGLSMSKFRVTEPVDGSGQGRAVRSALPPSSPKFDSNRKQPSAANARDQLERILANPEFMANAQRKALLRYLVE